MFLLRAIAAYWRTLRAGPGVPDARVDEWLREARARHQADDLAGAEAACRRILQARPAHPGALYLLGAIAHRSGRHEEAIGLLEAATAANGAEPASERELAAVLAASGRLPEAVERYRRALALDPADLASHVDLAAVLLALDRPEAAERHCRSALALAPDSVPALVNLAAALEGQGRLDEAEARLERALALEARCVPALSNLASVRLARGRTDEARRHAQAALALDPQCVEARVNLANVLLEEQQPEEAIACLEQALRLRPRSPAILLDLGFAYQVKGELGNALSCYDAALALDPANPRAHVNRASILLLREDFAGGWKEFEWRLRLREQAWLEGRYRCPRWDGGALSGRTLAVGAEQGLGDEIMYASCLPDLLAQAAHVIVECDPRLEALFRRSFPRATILGAARNRPFEQPAGAPAPDCWIPAASLPLHLRRSAADFPHHAGYLRADPERVAAWRERLAALGPAPKIGLSWRGGAQKTGRARRSLDLEQLLPALRAREAIFVNLQYGDCSREIAALAQAHRIAVHHWPEAIADYDETAALVTALDLVLSVCTAVVHLGGALGRPVWVLAPLVPEARYGLAGERMRWYPSVRMFRQPRFGDWKSPIAALAHALAAWRR